MKISAPRKDDCYAERGDAAIRVGSACPIGTEGIPAGDRFGDHWAMAVILGSNLGDLIRAGIPTLVRRTRGRSPRAMTG